MSREKSAKGKEGGRMKKLSVTGIILFGSCFLSTACTDQKNAAEQRGSAIVQPLVTTRSVEKKVNVLEMQKSIQEYYAANGRYPADLNEVAAFNGMTLERDRYVYDPATGALAQRP
jgi:hypothetical protein